MELLELALALDAKLLVEHLPHAADAVALVILAAGLLDDALGIHAGELHGDRGVDLLADADLAHAGRPGPAAAEHLLGLAAGDRRADRPVVQGRQLLGVQAPQRLDLGHQRRQEQRLHQPVVVAEGRPLRVVVGQCLDLFAAAMLLLQDRQQLLMVEPLGVVEVDRHVLAEGLVAVGHDVEQVAHGHHVAQLERLAVVHQELHHHLQGRPLPLEHAGDRDQRLHQGRAEGIDLAEHLAVALVGQQDAHHAVLHPRHLLEGRVEFGLGGPVLALQHPLLGDRRQVPVLQGDRVEPPLLVVQRVAEAQPLGPGHMLPDQLPQVPLPGHEAHDRHGPVHRLGLHQVRQLGRLVVDEAQVGRVHGQPEDQLVEEQDQGVVAQAGRVLADDRQALVEPYEIPAAVADDFGVRGGDGL